MTDGAIRVLLVENDAVDRMAIERFVRKHALPYRLEVVETLGKALEGMKKTVYDLILVDYLLTDGTGFEILSKAAGTPVVVITGHGDEDIAVEAMRQGAYDYIIKDLNRNYLTLIPSTINDVLARKKAKIEKAESDKRYRTIVETVSDIIFQLDTEQRITFVNPAIRDLGYDPAKVIGQHIEEFLCHEDRGKIGLIATRRIGVRATRNLEIRFLSRDGVAQWHELKGMAVLLDSYGLWNVSESIVQTIGTEKIFLGTLCIGRNITKRKQAEEALRESELRHRTVLDNVPEVIITTNHQGVIETFSLAGERIFGYSASEITGNQFDALVDKTARNRHDVDIDDFFRGDSNISITMKSSEFMGRRKDGSVFPMDLSVTRMHRGKLNMFTAIIRDITGRKQSEQRLKRVTVELERSNQELQNFAFVASHDLQEPLRKIATFGDRLRSVASDLSEQGLDYLDRMLKSAQRMQRLIDDLLLFSRVTSKAKEFEPTDFNKIISEVLVDLEVRIAQTKGTVNVVNLPTLPADPFQMGQLFQNLIGNALKFHKADVPPVVNLSGSRDDHGNWEIKVADNGIGFEEKYTERVFKPFERLHARSSYDGTGMGLAICQKIVDRHNGEIEVKSVPSQGTTFLIRFREKPADQSSPNTESAAHTSRG